MKIEEAIKWMEEAVQNVRDFLEQWHPVQVSPTLQEKLTKQNEVFELAIDALRSMPEAAVSPNAIADNVYLGGGIWMSKSSGVTWMPLPEPPEVNDHG